MKNATTNTFEGSTRSRRFHAAGQVGLGELESRQVLKSVYDRILDAGSVFVLNSTNVRLGGVDMIFRQVSYKQLPQPIKRKLVQLKMSDIGLPEKDDIPGLYQFIGELEDQYLYLIEHPENIFLAHLGKLIAYGRK